MEYFYIYGKIKVLVDILILVMTFWLKMSELTDSFGNSNPKLIERKMTWKVSTEHCLHLTGRLLDENEMKNYTRLNNTTAWTREYKTYVSKNWNVELDIHVKKKLCKFGFYRNNNSTFKEHNCTKEHPFLCKLEKESLTSAGKKHTTENPSTKESENISKDNIELMTTNTDDDTTKDVILPTVGIRQQYSATSEHLVTKEATSNKNTLKPHGIEEESKTITLILSGCIGGGLVVFVVIIVCIVRKRARHDRTIDNGEPEHILSEPYSVATRGMDEMNKELEHAESNENRNADVKVTKRNNQIPDEDIGDYDHLNSIQVIKNTSMVKFETYQGQDDIYNQLDNGTTNKVVTANNSKYDHVVINHNEEDPTYYPTREKICTSNDENYDQSR